MRDKSRIAWGIVGIIAFTVLALLWIRYRRGHQVVVEPISDMHIESLHFKVLDQTGQPVPGAKLAFVIPTTSKQGNHITEDTIGVADEQGRYTFKPTIHSLGFELTLQWGFTSSGRYIIEDGYMPMLQYKQYSGWRINGLVDYQPGQGWRDLPGGLIEKDQVITLRAGTSGGPEPMIWYTAKITGDRKGAAMGVDVVRGQVQALPCPQCDFAVLVQPCNHGQGFLLEVRAQRGGGVLFHDPVTMTDAEAAESGYSSRIRGEKFCDASVHDGYSPLPENVRNIVVFHSRKKNIYGTFDYIGLDRKPAEDDNDIEWTRINVIANPRGSRNLFAQREQSIKLPLSESQLPYHDDWKLDFSKIEVTEDKAKGEVTVRGLPGVTMGICGKFSIAINGTVDDARWVIANHDGSFVFTRKASLQDTIELVYNTSSDRSCESLSGEAHRIFVIKAKLMSEQARASTPK